MSHNEFVFWGDAILVGISLLSLAAVYLTRHIRHKKHPP